MKHKPTKHKSREYIFNKKLVIFYEIFMPKSREENKNSTAPYNIRLRRKFFYAEKKRT